MKIVLDIETIHCTKEEWARLKGVALLCEEQPDLMAAGEAAEAATAAEPATAAEEAEAAVVGEAAVAVEIDGGLSLLSQQCNFHRRSTR